ncbi:MAG: hypothetical protein EA379_06705 [Phycisphaerales bacterium]|nr:MAG: hypothetical protein EA379_06705 [Phycisphaerales bacterium]
MAQEFGKVRRCIEAAEKITEGKQPPSNKDRREYARHTYVIETPVVWLNSSKCKAEDVNRVETEDISVGGIRIIGRRMLYPGTVGVLQLERPDATVALVGVEVMHTDYIGDMRYASGCRFIPVPKNVIVKNFINTDGRMMELRPGELPVDRPGARRSA